MAGLETIAGARILLVEDNEINQQVALELLRQAHFKIDLAENGRIALTQLQTREYDLVLMDMQMPVMDGLAATKEIRCLPRFEHLPIVAMTANALMADRQRCFDVGMNDFLAKPIEPEELWQALLKWIPARYAPSPLPAINPDEPVQSAELNFSVAGIEMAPALRRMLGNTEIYISTLRKFCSLQVAMPENTLSALNAEDWTTAQRHAHTLKGVSASIGANELAQEAALLEQAIAERHSREEIISKLEVVSVVLAKLIEAIKYNLPEVVVKARLTPVESAAAAGKFAQLLVENNPEVMAWMEANSAALATLIPPARMMEIEAAVRAFDLDDALRLLIDTCQLSVDDVRVQPRI
jgi:two-component system sensor histidine kinase/response regulator